MRIAVLGAGAMGSIYAGHLSKNNQVILIDTNKELVEKINKDGVFLEEKGEKNNYKPQAYYDTKNLEPVDLMIVFVKSIFSEVAIEQNKHLISDKTLLMSLQNGAGHGEILNKFVSDDRVVLGTTEDNGAVLDLGFIRHGGEGKTNLGAYAKDNSIDFEELKSCFEGADFKINIEENIQQLIWNKIITNASLSVLTGILQVSIGHIARNEYSWKLCQKLIGEILEVGRAQGLSFDTESEIEKVKEVSINNPDGYTSIYADIKNARRTEVDTISGAIVKAGEKFGVKTPYSEMAVDLVHALELKNLSEKERKWFLQVYTATIKVKVFTLY